MKESKSYEFGKAFGDAVNNMSFRSAECALAMSREHRTLQHNMFDVCLHYLYLLRENYNNRIYDDRNEFACKCANEMIQHLIDKNILYTPSVEMKIEEAEKEFKLY